MPVSGLDGLIQILAGFPEWRPIPLKDTGFLIVFWFKYDTPQHKSFLKNQKTTNITLKDKINWKVEKISRKNLSFFDFFELK